ncbi:hypothetical protein HOI18_03745 [Candidatus Uhrbacteria bacterium]|jgi:hypothetical protein|nr:hypothetical protein [Candidatus Uhrbacteria bacterium]
MHKAPATLVARYVLRDGLKQLVLLPVWWYTSGLKLVFYSTLHSMKNASVFFGLGVWVKNLFVPMYGETTLTGRVISFGVRFVMIIFRGIGTLTFSVIAWIGFAIYVIIMPVLLLTIVINFLSLLF